MNQELLTQYMDVCTKIALLEEEKEKLNTEVVAHLKEQGVDKFSSEIGTFSIGVRKAWEYTDAVKKKQDEVKELKLKEEEEGVATAKETEYLTYRKPGKK